MKDTDRLIVNTLVQHLRTILNILMSLYSTRIVLDALGELDYGVYVLVAGIVSFLSYITNSMIATTQRYLSYSYGEGDKVGARTYFHNSYMLHLLLGISVSLVLVSLTSALFDTQFLDIDSSKIGEAKNVYLLVISSVLFSLLASPFRALLTAKENIVYISIVDIIDGFLKLSLVFLLYIADDHRLSLYAVIMSFVMLFNLLALAIYAKFQYNEASLIPDWQLWNKIVQKKLVGFATWTLYGTICIYLRAQGVAILLNRSFGSLINTAFGVANQVYTSILYLNQAILNAFMPQIVKAEGTGDRSRMLMLSQEASKYCYLLLLFVSVPLMFEFDGVLSVWLGKTPKHATLFCQMLIVAALFDQLTTGLNVSIQALGRIRNYTLAVYTIKLLTVIAFWFLLKHDYPLVIAASFYIGFEILSAVVRLIYTIHVTELALIAYLRHVVFPVVLPSFVIIAVSAAMTCLPEFPFRFLATGIACILGGGVVCWFMVFKDSERQYIMIIRNKILKRNV